MPEELPVPWWRARTGIAVIGFGLVIAFYVLREHYAHAFGLLPYLLLFSCPLMHLFMHHGHGGHAKHHSGASRAASSDELNRPST
jgi:hypothetical protein